MGEKPLTVNEVADLLGYHPDHVRRLLRAGKVKGERLGWSWLIDRQEAERVKALQGPTGQLPRGPGKVEP